jgi:hypothetical protein
MPTESASLSPTPSGRDTPAPAPCPAEGASTPTFFEPLDARAIFRLGALFAGACRQSGTVAELRADIARLEPIGPALAAQLTGTTRTDVLVQALDAVHVLFAQAERAALARALAQATFTLQVEGPEGAGRSLPLTLMAAPATEGPLACTLALDMATPEGAQAWAALTAPAPVPTWVKDGFSSERDWLLAGLDIAQRLENWGEVDDLRRQLADLGPV